MVLFKTKNVQINVIFKTVEYVIHDQQIPVMNVKLVLVLIRMKNVLLFQKTVQKDIQKLMELCIVLNVLKDTQEISHSDFP